MRPKPELEKTDVIIRPSLTGQQMTIPQLSP